MGDSLLLRHQAAISAMFKAKQQLGKYRIQRRLSRGPFADVYAALDTIEGVRVALKIPQAGLMTKEFLEDFRKEVRLMARLDHANILRLKDASFIGSRLVIAFPLGEGTLADRMCYRLSLRTMLDYAGQMLEAVAHAHSNQIIHCDIKPENFILFSGNQLRLTDFGIAKVAHRTIQASGSGTVGYVAPEQAMGKPSVRSDVFSLGLVFYRMFSGHLPEWPYTWPPPGFAKLRERVHPDLIGVIHRAMQIDPRKRFKSAVQMQAALKRAKPRALRRGARLRKRTGGGNAKGDWKTIRRRQFQKEYGAALQTRFSCPRCGGPVSEPMRACPWCGAPRSVHRDETRFPARCPRCMRGMKLDWRYCPWCYGAGFAVSANRHYSDAQYQARCSSPGCSPGLLMPFMRYCPWCRRKVRRKWKLPDDGRERCPSCGWGVVKSFWDYCPWCGKRLRGR